MNPKFKKALHYIWQKTKQFSRFLWKITKIISKHLWKATKQLSKYLWKKTKQLAKYIGRKIWAKAQESAKGQPKKKVIQKIIVFSVELIILIILLIGVAGLSLFVYYAKDLPRPEKFTERPVSESTKIYDRTGNVLLYELYNEEKREVIPLSEISQNLKNAVIATEDAKFYKHHGIDLQGIIRSIEKDLRLRSTSYGGSTISQQLIRSTFLSTEKTVARKVREIILTLEMERKYPKDQILEWYLNQIPFGPNLYGIQTASKAFFNKSAKDLTVNESAILAAMIQSPSVYSNHIDRLTIRKNYVLDRMVSENYLSKEDAEKAKQEEVKLPDQAVPMIAPHFVLYVKDYLSEKYGDEFLNTSGLKVYTTLDVNMQNKAEEIVSDGAKKNRAANAYNASLVAIDPKTGNILSMVGSADWNGTSLPEGCAPGVSCKFDPKVNIATYNIGRQPGSSFKPFVYATAFEKGYDDKTVVVDEFTNFGVYGGKAYTPQNYDGLFRGAVTLRSALAQSLNIPAVKVILYMAGIKDSVENAKSFGITTLTKDPSYYGPSLVLGGGEVKLLDMVSAYGVFPTEGMRIPSTPILKIEDSNGKVIEKNDITPRRVLQAQAAKLISSILSDNDARAPMFGYNSQLHFPNYQVAVKTGTTGDYRDGWTIGYTPSIVVGVWAGNNDNTPINRRSGAMIAAPMWHSFMNYVLPKYPTEYFNLPDGMIDQQNTSNIEQLNITDTTQNTTASDTTGTITPQQ